MRLPVFAILQSLEIVLVMILDELFGGSGFLFCNRRGNRHIGTGVKIAAIVLQVDGSEPHGSIVTVHSDRR